jgi:hypothetical protein
MGVLADIYIKAETLQTLANVVAKKGDKGISITISIDDKNNQYEQNVSAYVSQTKEQREAKKDRFYAGNGKVFWSDGKPVKTSKELEEAKAPAPQAATPHPANGFIDLGEDLPFS